MTDTKQVTDNNVQSPARRSFLKKGAGFTFAVGASGLVSSLGFGDEASAAISENSLTPNIWVTINPDNTILAKYAGTDMGQGSMTHVPMMLADYMDADWDKVEVDIVTVHDTAYGNPIFQNWLYTAGSTQIYIYGPKLAMAGTQARKMLMMAVANAWGVDIAELTTEPSMVVHQASGKQISYGDIVATLEMPAEAPEVDESEFKPEADFRYIGKSVPRRDRFSKSDGSAQYAIDVNIPGMAYAAIRRTPVEGERPLAVDTSRAEKVKGIIDFVTLPYGVAIVGETVEATQKAKSMLDVTWSEESRFRNSSTDTQLEEYSREVQDLNKEGTPWAGGGQGDVHESLASAAKVHEALYTSDAAYHGQIEPLNAIASVSDDGKSAEIWVGTQGQSPTIVGSAETLETSYENITLHPMPMGGGFGRRGLVHADYLDDALLVSKAMKRPIKVIWSREDDVEAGTYRTAAAQFLRGGFDEAGKLVAVHHRVGSPEIIPQMNKHRWEAVKPVDVIAMLGSENRAYDIPNHLPEHVKTQRHSRINAWRGISTSYTKFAIESFIDELAFEGNIDPMEFRLQLTHNNPRINSLFEEVAEMSDWGSPRGPGIGMGVAFGGYSSSFSVGVAEITVDADTGVIRINKYWGVGDSGKLISPRNAHSQFVSNVIWGFNCALRERITIENGVAQQTNFHDYPIIRMNELPEMDIKMLETDFPSSGVGELGLCMVAPSIANAVFSLTGVRIRHMPLTPDVVSTALIS